MDQFRPFPLNQQTQSGAGLLGLKERQATMKGKSTLVKPTREALGVRFYYRGKYRLIKLNIY